MIKYNKNDVDKYIESCKLSESTFQTILPKTPIETRSEEKEEIESLGRTVNKLTDKNKGDDK